MKTAIDDCTLFFLLKNFVFLPICFAAFPFFSFAQKITYNNQIAPIIHKNCFPCHRKGTNAPFELFTYGQVSLKIKTIHEVIEKNVMPPWPADPEYRHFQNELIISDEEKALINQWIATGVKRGNPHFFVKKRTRNKVKKSILAITLETPAKYQVTRSHKDQFIRFYYLPPLKRDLDINSFEFYPGNRDIVHHMEIWNSIPLPQAFDTIEGEVKAIISDDLALSSPLIRSDTFITGILPGNFAEKYPEDVAVRLYKNSVMLALIHYAPTALDTTDFSRMNLYQSKTVPSRFAHTISILNHRDKMLNGPLFIPAHSIREFHSVKKIENDISVFAIMPHAHLLCRKFQAFAVISPGDTIPLIRINEWNFDWQYVYRFKEYQVLPAGTEVHVIALYDNTIDNPRNPSVPPVDVGTSNKAEDEMMALFLIGVPYREGDRGKEIKY